MELFLLFAYQFSFPALCNPISISLFFKESEMAAFDLFAMRIGKGEMFTALETIFSAVIIKIFFERLPLNERQSAI
jgi:hypothetical protein